MPAIETAGLTKRFGRVRAVDEVELLVPAGAVFGFLGPNGSGKTTTIRMLLGLVFPTAGSVRLLDDAPDALARTGALIDGPAFHPYLTGTANLVRLDAADRSADPRTTSARVGAALERVGLTAAAGKRYRAYSLGMRQRLGIAAALLRPRELLVLDEPTNGLDPQGTREIRTLIGELARDGTTIFCSTHLLTEVTQICTHVAVMREGRLVWQGPLDDLGAGEVPHVRVSTAQQAAAVRVLRAEGLADARESGGDVVATLTATVDGVRHDLADRTAHDRVAEQLVAALVRADVGVHGFAVERPSLEQLFVELTGSGFDVSG